MAAILITLFRVLITLLTITHEPPSAVRTGSDMSQLIPCQLRLKPSSEGQEPKGRGPSSSSLLQSDPVLKGAHKCQKAEFWGFGLSGPQGFRGLTAWGC